MKERYPKNTGNRVHFFLARLSHIDETSGTVLFFEGAWVTDCLKETLVCLEKCRLLSKEKTLVIDFSRLVSLDTSGAYVIQHFCKALEKEGLDPTIKGLRQDHQILFDQIRKRDFLSSVPELKKQSVALQLLHDLGVKTHKVSRDSIRLLSFVGQVVINLVGLLRSPGLLKRVSVVFHLQKVGLQALPIVGLISFLIGVVLVYQGAHQLKRFGAEIFTIDLLAVSVLREIGILLTSIVVAGRSGSAFTAQIGTMSLNQEIDALRVMGLNPIQYLVIPRVLALLIALPLLGFFANVVALLGGAVMGCALIGVDFQHFFQHLNLAIKPWTFWTGMIKAPIFAFVIAIVGCFEGMRVEGGAESVGRHTTKSVVKSIFLVIILDAAFSIFYSLIGI